MWDKIKQILAKNPSGTCIIVEEGKPAYVISVFDQSGQQSECECQISSAKRDISDQGLLEKINEEITNWKARQIEAEPEVEVPEEEDDSQVKIENLPII